MIILFQICLHFYCVIPVLFIKGPGKHIDLLFHGVYFLLQNCLLEVLLDLSSCLLWGLGHRILNSLIFTSRQNLSGYVSIIPNISKLKEVFISAQMVLIKVYCLSVLCCDKGNYESNIFRHFVIHFCPILQIIIII